MHTRSASGFRLAGTPQPRRRQGGAQLPLAAVLSASVAALLLSACGSARPGSRPETAVLTQDEISTATGQSVFDVVQQLRPQFLRSRGTRTLQNAGSGEPVIYVDNVRLGGLEVLRTIRAAEVDEVRYLTPAEATTRYGTGHLGGAIAVTLRRT